MDKPMKFERTKHDGWGIYLNSGCDEWPGCRLNLRVPGWWVTFRLPPVIRPIRTWRDLEPMLGKPGYQWLKPGPDGRYGYAETFAREYSLSYGERYVHVRYGRQTMDSSTDKSWCKELPWLAWRFVRHTLYDLDGVSILDLENAETKLSYSARDTAQRDQPSAYFEFADYDGERIKVRCRIEEREWRRGTGWFRWLAWLSSPEKSRSLDLDFSSEVGRRKGSWKGGTTGHSVSIGIGEAPESAFRRYCDAHDLTFIGACEPWSRAAMLEVEQASAALTQGTGGEHG